MFLVRYCVVGYGIGSDGDGYYMYMPSILLDHDLNFTNQGMERPWLQHNNSFIQKENQFKNDSSLDTVRQKPYINVWPIGTAIFLFPFFILAHAIAIILNSFGFGIPLNGYSDVHQIITMIGSIAYAVIGLILCYKIAKKYIKDKDKILVSIVIVTFGSYMIQYIAIEPSMSHNVSFFVSTLFFYIFLEKIYQKSDAKWYIIWGLVGGLMVCTRQQNIFNFILPLIMTLYEMKLGKVSLKRVLLFFLSFAFFLLALSPLLISDYYMFGNLLGNRFSEINLLNPHMIGTLFTYNSSIMATPLIYVAIIGFIFLIAAKRKIDDQKDFMILLALFIVLMAQIYFNSTSVLQGADYGARRLDGVFLIFIIGFAFLLEVIEKTNNTVRLVIFAIVALLFIYNIVSLLSFNLNLYDRLKPITGYDKVYLFIKFCWNVICTRILP